MAQPVFQQSLEEDWVQRVGTKLTLEVVVEETDEKVFFEWRGPAGSNVEDGRVLITEAGCKSTAEITPLHLQVTSLFTMCSWPRQDIKDIECFRTKECGPARLKINTESLKLNAMSSPKVDTEMFNLILSC